MEWGFQTVKDVAGFLADSMQTIAYTITSLAVLFAVIKNLFPKSFKRQSKANQPSTIKPGYALVPGRETPWFSHDDSVIWRPTIKKI